MIDPKFFCFVAQMAHFFCGAFLMCCCGLFFPQYFYWVWLVAEGIAAVKEFWYDQNYENAATRGSNFLDWSMYSLGGVAAFCVLKAKGLL